MKHMNVTELRPLISPAVLLQDLPITCAIANQVTKTRQQIQAILSGDDDRLLVIVGPCSIHDEQAALEYAARLAEIQDQFEDTLCLIMRVYFEKPRTSIGWKGLINDPGLNQQFDINSGLYKARKLLLDINALGVAAATEFIDVIIPPFLSDCISWGAIGARTTESQIHRQLASGLPMPMGFKNGTTGNVQIAIDAVRAARQAHHYLGITDHGTPAIFQTSGNPHCHVILRGAHDHTNYDAQYVHIIREQLVQSQLPPFLMVDCSHGNSQKDHTRQQQVAASLCQQIATNQRAIAGVMIESHLNAGRQPYQPDVDLKYGVSITDACIDWPQTHTILENLSEAVKVRALVATQRN